MKRSTRTIVDGEYIGFVIVAASIVLLLLFSSCGAGAVAVYNQGWLVLLPGVGCGALVGAALGAIFAPAEYTSAKVCRFILEIAFLAPAITVLGAIIILRLLGKL